VDAARCVSRRVAVFRLWTVRPRSLLPGLRRSDDPAGRVVSVGAAAALPREPSQPVRTYQPRATLRAHWVTRRARWATLRARWVTLRARWVTLRARWVTLRARWGALRASWVTLRARWVTLRARWVTLRARWVTLRARWVTLRARWGALRARWVTLRARWVNQVRVRPRVRESHLLRVHLQQRLPDQVRALLIGQQRCRVH
jgi:hypothetical protein